MVYVKIFIYVTLQFPISNKNFLEGGIKAITLLLFIICQAITLLIKKKFLRNVIN